jgi:hypothetical protein
MNQERKESAAERRRRERAAAQRREAWERLRGETAGPVPVHQPPYTQPHVQQPHVQQPAGVPTYGSATPGHPSMESLTEPRAAAPNRSGRLRGIAKPVLLAVVATFTATGATPLVSGNWNIVGLLLGLLVTGAILLVPGGDRRWARAGSVVGVLLLVAGLLGAVQQNVINGDAQLRGSRLDRAVRTFEEIDRSVEILRENQRLLDLLPEQSIGLMGTFTAAADQAVLIAERWNPATNPDIATEGLEALMVEVNVAAARQGLAFRSHIANLENNEPGIAEQAARLKSETETMLNGSVVDALAQTRREIWGEEQK